MTLDTNAIRSILDALDRDEVGKIADVNGTAPALVAAIQRRYDCKAEVWGLSPDGDRTEVSDEALADYRKAVAAAGGNPDRVKSATPGKAIRVYDVIVTLDGFGSRHKIKHLRPLMEDGFDSQTRLVLDIKQGSGSYPFLKAYGTANTLVEPTDAQPGRAVVSANPPASSAGAWSEIAKDLARDGGWFRDLGEHSMLFEKRSDTLVVTFDNLDIAMDKRDDRRPWGYSFIEAQGWSMLGVMAAGWTWFRDPSVDAEFVRLRDEGFFDQFSRVVFYGASMGGYAAAAFSAACPGATVFVTSPQSTLDKAIVPWEMRYKTAWDRDFSGPFGDASVASRSAAAVHLLYDPYVAPDAAHAARFDGDNVVHWRCPLLGHRLGSSLQQMGALKQITVAAIEGRLDRNLFYTTLRKRRDLPRYQRELVHHALDRGHQTLALKACNFVLARRADKALSAIVKQLQASAAA